MDLQTLRSRIQDYVNRRGMFVESSSVTNANLDQAHIDEAINSAIREITTMYRFALTEVTQVIHLVSTQEAYLLNSDYQSMRYVVLLDPTAQPLGELMYASPLQYDALTVDSSLVAQTQSAPTSYSLILAITDGVPAIYTIEGGGSDALNIRVKPTPTDSTMSMAVHYNQFYPELDGSDGAHNYFTDNYPRYCLFGALDELVEMFQIRGDNTVIQDIQRQKTKWIDIITASESMSKSQVTHSIPVGFKKISYRMG